MNFRIRFNILETATESLIKFMKLVLTEIGGDKFNRFPSTLYLAKKSFVSKTDFIVSYLIQNVINFTTEMK